MLHGDHPCSSQARAQGYQHTHTEASSHSSYSLQTLVCVCVAPENLPGEITTAVVIPRTGAGEFHFQNAFCDFVGGVELVEYNTLECQTIASN